MSANYRGALPLFRLFKKRYGTLTGNSTDLCIEGFPRSGNTYFVSAFTIWNRNLRVSHHTHSAGSVKDAVKRNLPTVVLIRKPEDCVASVMAWDGRLKSTVGLIAYIHFYSSVVRYSSRIVVLTFEEATTAPDNCVKKINLHFKTDYRYTEFGEEEDRKIRARLKQGDKILEREDLNASLPNDRKSQSKEKYTEAVLGSRLYKRAMKLYTAFTAGSGTDSSSQIETGHRSA